MSVDRIDYIIYGWILEPTAFKIEEDDYEKYEKHIEGSPEAKGFIIIEDGMSGEYTVVGEIVNVSGDRYIGWEFEEIIKSSKSEEHLIKQYKDILEMEPKEKPKLFIFSHFC